MQFDGAWELKILTSKKVDCLLLSNFIQNSAGSSGGAVLVVGENTSLNCTGVSNFTDNSVVSGNGGAISAPHTLLLLSFTGTSNFTGNSAADGGAIYAYNTSMNFAETTNFVNNSAPAGKGGGVYLIENSKIFILPNTMLT